MKASDIMSSPVITVGPDAPVREIAVLLFEKRISAVPVMQDGALVGLVSEADLLHRCEIGTDHAGRAGSWWQRLFSTDRSPAEYIKSHAKQARDVMSREVVSVAPQTPVAEIATLLERRGIKRVPVLRGTQLVGIVSRADLVQALALERHGGKRAPSLSDEAIRKRLLAELERQAWWRPAASNVFVADGVVQYSGLIEASEERDAARVAAENVPGVRGVEDRRQCVQDLPSMV